MATLKKKPAPKSTDKQILAELREGLEQLYIKLDQNVIPKLDRIIKQNNQILSNQNRDDTETQQKVNELDQTLTEATTDLEGSVKGE